MTIVDTFPLLAAGCLATVVHGVQKYRVLPKRHALSKAPPIVFQTVTRQPIDAGRALLPPKRPQLAPRATAYLQPPQP